MALLLWDANLLVHRSLLKDGGALLVNSDKDGEGDRVDGSGIAREMGNAVLSNLVLLGLAVNKNALFCSEEECLVAIRKLAPAKFVEQNLQAFHTGMKL